MSDSRSILLKLSVRDADVVRRELVAMGEVGSAALARLDAAARTAAGTGGAVSRGGGGGGGSGMAGFRGAIGQAGFQIQDFVVQVQGGTSALTALSQQGSQLLGIFGPAGAIAGAALTIGLLAVQLLGAGNAADALSKAIEDQADSYKKANDAAELYRTGLDREAETILRLGNLYASYSAERRRAEELRLGDQQADLARQQAALGTRAQGALPDGIQNMIDLAASRSARGQGIGAGAAEISPQLRDALTAIMEFRAVSDQVSSESLSRLSTRLQEAASVAGGDLAPSLLRAATSLRAMLPETERLEGALRQNAQQMAALRTGTDGAGTSLGGAAAAARQLADQLRRVQEIAAANPALAVQQEADGLRRRLDALRRGGTAGDDAEQRRLENERRVAEAINKAYEDQRRRLQDLGQTREQAEAGARSAAATVGQEVMRRNELADALENERKARERAERGTEAGTPDQLRNTLMQLRGQEDERLRREVERFTESMERPIDAYKRRMAEIESLAARARENGNPIPEEAIQRATDEALGSFNSLARGMEQNNQLGQQLGMTFSSAFEDAIVKGKSFREVLSGVAQDLARIVVRQSITAPLGNMLTKGIGNFDLGSVFSSVFGFGGGKAVGGPVMAGTAYVVGERGPELFMPAANGNIVPNHALGGGGVVMNLTINAQGAGPREIDVLRAQIPGMVRNGAMAAVEDAARRGGGFARSIRGG